MKKELYKAYIALGLVSFFWGTTYIASRVGAQHMPGFFIAGIRQFVSGIILVSFFLLRGYKLPGIQTLKRISIQGIFLLCIANGLLTWSLEYISGGLAAIIAAMVPLFIALFSVWLSKTSRLSKWMIIGLVVGFAGVLIIFNDYMGQLQSKNFLFGVGLALTSVLSWSFGTVYTSKQKSSVHILFNVGLQMLIAGMIMLIICGITGTYANLATTGTESWIALSYLILFGSLIAYSAFVYAVSKLPTTLVSVYAYINPIVAVSLGWLLLSEKMNLNMVLGTLVTIGGIYLVNREVKKNKTMNRISNINYQPEGSQQSAVDSPQPAVGSTQQSDEIPNKVKIITIKQADVSHIGIIEIIGKRSFRSAFEHLFDNKQELNEYLEHTYDPVKLTRSIRKENNIYLLAFQEGKPVGFAKIKKHSLNEQISSISQMELQKIYVLPEYQGSGAGTALMKEIEKRAGEIHPDYIWLDTHISNERAIRLYERNGFRKIGKYFFTIGTQTFEYYVLGLLVECGLAASA